MNRPTQLGSYRLARQLGAGGMGAVYEAVHVKLGAKRAVKVLPPSDDSELVLRFRREAEAQAAVDGHPHVLRVHEFGQERGQLYLVMDLVTGGDLRERLQRGPLPHLEAATIVRQLAEGLAHVHAHGVLHRDIKPANVVFDGNGTPKLADFGLAAAAGATSLTQTGALIGTPAYMAPEQALAQHGKVDARTDVYGLGAVLYRALSGQPPFGEGSVVALLTRVAKGGPRPLSEVAPDVPPQLERICMRALARDRSERYPSAEFLAADLRAFCAGLPASPRRSSPAPVLLGLFGAIALFVTGLAGISLLKSNASPPTPAGVDPTPKATVPSAPQTELERALAAAQAPERGSSQHRAAVQRFALAVAQEQSSTRSTVRALARHLAWDAASPVEAAALRLWCAHALVDSDPPTALACLKPLQSSSHAARVLTAAEQGPGWSAPLLDVVATVGLAYPEHWPRVLALLTPDPQAHATFEVALRDLVVLWLLEKDSAKLGSYQTRLQAVSSAEDPTVQGLALQYILEAPTSRQPLLRPLLARIDWDTACPELLRLGAYAHTRKSPQPGEDKAGDEYNLRIRANARELGPALGEALTQFEKVWAKAMGLGIEFEVFLEEYEAPLRDPLALAHVKTDFAELYVNASAYAKGRALLEEVLQTCPGHPRALMTLARVAEKEKAPFEVREYCRDVILLSPMNLLALRARGLRRVIRSTL